jgi:hypothetical protein
MFREFLELLDGRPKNRGLTSKQDGHRNPA